MKVSQVEKVVKVLKSKKSSEPTTMAGLLAQAKTQVRGFVVGEKVKGKIIAKTPKSIILDIGGKSEGIVAEKAFAEAKDLAKTLKVGDEITVTVIVPETREGNVLLSLRQQAFEANWEKLEKAQKEGREITVKGKAASPAGVTVEIGGIFGFIPSSQLGAKASQNPNELIETKFKVKIIEINKSANKVILSEKEVSEAGQIKQTERAIGAVKVGEIYEGVVTTITNFGCFVRLTVGKSKNLPTGREVEGLVHVSELSWEKVNKISDVVSLGDTIKVKVLEVRNGKLSLSLKQVQKDPWEEAVEKYPPETKFAGKVTRVSDFGVFVQIKPGLEGLIHITKIPPATKLRVGDEIKCLIEEINKQEKRISLGLVLSSKPVGYK